MPYRARIKICGMTRADDITSAVAEGADAIGLVFYPPSPRNVSIEAAAELAARVPAFVATVALFVDPERRLVEQVIARVQPDLLQFHGDESEAFCQGFGRPYIKALRVKDAATLAEQAEAYPSARALLLDSHSNSAPGGTGEKFDWTLIPQRLRQRIILAGGLAPDNVGQAIERLKPYAVDVSSGVEKARGEKDPAAIRDFIEQVRLACGRSSQE